MRKYWFGKVEIADIVKKIGLLAIVGALFATYMAAIEALWVKIVILSLIGLLFLYVLYHMLLITPTLH